MTAYWLQAEGGGDVERVGRRRKRGIFLVRVEKKTHTTQRVCVYHFEFECACVGCEARVRRSDER